MRAKLAGLMIALLTGGAPATADIFTSFEDEERDICAGPEDTAVFTYYKDSYYDLDKNLMAVMGGSPYQQWLARPTEKQVERLAFDHERVQGLIPRMGRLFPRMNKPLDIPPMIAQLREGEIWAPVSGYHTEILNVALARLLIQSEGGAGAKLADFLDAFDAYENRLLDLKGEGLGEKTAQELDFLRGEVASRYRESLRLIGKEVIFAPDFRDRLMAGLQATCAEVAEEEE